MNLQGRTAVVTGGNVGIGRAIALALAEAGADVAVTYLTHPGEDTAEAIRQFGRKAVSLALDATDSIAVHSAFSILAQEWQHLDILVNNAGGLIARAPLAEMDDALWRHVFDANVTSAFYCTRAVLPWMPTGGRIVNIGSIAAHHGGGPGAAAYAAAKGAIHTLTRGMAKEFAARGITVNAVAPGFILDTPFHPTFTPPAVQAESIRTTPLGRGGTPADVAGAVLYLTSDLATFITGEVLEVNGGLLFA